MPEQTVQKSLSAYDNTKDKKMDWDLEMIYFIFLIFIIVK